MLWVMKEQGATQRSLSKTRWPWLKAEHRLLRHVSDLSIQEAVGLANRKKKKKGQKEGRSKQRAAKNARLRGSSLS